MIRIITDSAADLTAQDLAHPGVYVVPMAITFEDGSSIEDNGQMTKDEFFQRLASDSKLPRTSQPSPAAFIEAYADAELDGDEVIVITVGQKLSGTYQCAVMAANDVDTPVYVVDSETATQGEAVILREALRLRDMGLSAQQIVDVLERFKKRVRIVAVVDSLKHLQKGGRVSAAVAIVGGALGIKPVIALYESTVKLAGKGRGRPGALVSMFKQLDEMGGIDTNYPCVVLYSDEKQMAAPVHHYLTQNLKLEGVRTSQIGATIGTHVGPRATGIVFVAKESL